jgi:hypothetical protein
MEKAAEINQIKQVVMPKYARRQTVLAPLKMPLIT